MKQAIFALLVALLAPASARAELKIVTTLTDFADLAKQIGGDRVSVHSVMRGPENVHNVMAKPTEMLALNKADLFVHSGLDAEPWRDNLLKGARNPRVMPGKPGNVDMSRGIELREVPAGRIDRSQGDVHAYGNPHYTPDPRNALRMVATLANAMAEADPANAGVYRDNAKRVVNEIADLTKELKAKLEPYGSTSPTRSASTSSPSSSPSRRSPLRRPTCGASSSGRRRPARRWSSWRPTTASTRRSSWPTRSAGASYACPTTCTGRRRRRATRPCCVTTSSRSSRRRKTQVCRGRTRSEPEMENGITPLIGIHGASFGYGGRPFARGPASACTAPTAPGRARW
jgi:hypothetical protein